MRGGRDAERGGPALNITTEQRDLFDLLDALCGGEISVPQHARLEQLLSADPNARRLYFDYLDMHLYIRQWQRIRGQGVESPELRVESPESRVESLAEYPEAPNPRIPESPIINGQWPVASGQRRENINTKT